MLRPIQLARSEILKHSAAPWESLSFFERRWLAARILAARQGDWSNVIRVLQGGIPSANIFTIIENA